MRIYNRYLALLVLALCLVDISLAFLKQSDVAVYFTISVIVYLVITLLFFHFSPRARKILSVVSFVFLAGFIAVVILKTVEVLQGK